MKNMSFCLLIIIVFSSCKKEKSDLELTLLNDEIICIKDINPKTIESTAGQIYIDKVYDSISRNVLNYKLTNNSDKKYFIVLDENYLDAMENDYLFMKLIKNRIGKKSGLSFNLYGNEKIINGKTTLTSGCHFSKNELEYYKSNQYKSCYIDSLFIENIKKRKLYNVKFPTLNYRTVLNNSFVIYPGESKYFTSVTNLPIRKEGTDWISFIDTLKPNKGSLTLVNIAKYTIENLSNNQKREIKENHYEIFNGIINSNKVPIKYISMPKK